MEHFESRLVIQIIVPFLHVVVMSLRIQYFFFRLRFEYSCFFRMMARMELESWLQVRTVISTMNMIDFSISRVNSYDLFDSILIWYFLFQLIYPLPFANAINTHSIRMATEYQVKRARSYIEDNYVNVINSGEQYAVCQVYDLCTNPPSLVGDSSETISPWSECCTPWHDPLCNRSATLIGVRPNNHNQETGESLTSNTCPAYNGNSGCGWDNCLSKPGIKIPDATNKNSQEFLDATCFANDLEYIWTTRLYSNCHNDSECDIRNGDFCDVTKGICNNTQTPNIYSFEPQFVESQYFGDQRTGTHTTIPAKYWDALGKGNCPGSYDPRFRPWYVMFFDS